VYSETYRNSRTLWSRYAPPPGGAPRPPPAAAAAAAAASCASLDSSAYVRRQAREVEKGARDGRSEWKLRAKVHSQFHAAAVQTVAALPCLRATSGMT
jgi:uncharacterized OsmC-like protein